MANGTKQFTGLQKVLKQMEKRLVGLQSTPVAYLAVYLQVTEKTIMNWLRADGVSLTEPRVIDNPVARAVTAHGGPVAVAAVMGVTYQAVTQWIGQGYVPLKRVPEFEIQFGVPRAQLVSPKVRNATGAGGEL